MVIDINKVIVGFVVDAVSEVLRITADTVEPPPPVVAGHRVRLHQRSGQAEGQAADPVGSGPAAVRKPNVMSWVGYSS